MTSEKVLAVIGDMETLNSFLLDFRSLTPEELREYIEKHYPPDVEGLLEEGELGELTPGEIEQIVTHFKQHEAPRCCEVCEEQLGPEGDCPTGCTEDPGYGIIEGWYRDDPEDEEK